MRLLDYDCVQYCGIQMVIDVLSMHREWRSPAKLPRTSDQRILALADRQDLSFPTLLIEMCEVMIFGTCLRAMLIYLDGCAAKQQLRGTPASSQQNICRYGYCRLCSPCGTQGDEALQMPLLFRCALSAVFKSEMINTSSQCLQAPHDGIVTGKVKDAVQRIKNPAVTKALFYNTTNPELTQGTSGNENWHSWLRRIIPILGGYSPTSCS